MKTKNLPLLSPIFIGVLLTQCSSSSFFSAFDGHKPVPGRVSKRVVQANGHRYLEQRRVIRVEPLETVTTTTQLRD